MTEFKLPYGLKDNELFSIDEVDNGLSCNCVCPACGNKLIAKKGSIKNHHFAHYKSVDCFGGLETALHQMCKELIFNSETFTTPTLCFPQTSYEIFEETKIPVDNVILEKKMGGIIPDIVIESKGKKLLVEVVVNNPVDYHKRLKIEKENIATIVIYAKYLLKDLYLKKDFRLNDINFQNEIINGTKYKFWLHNPKIEKVKARLKNEYANKKDINFFDTDLGKYYFVYDCPIEKRHWKKGRNEGKPYATIDDDCKKCTFCVDIEYGDLPTQTIKNYGRKILKTVHCIGHQKSGLRRLLKQLT
jgi:Holliday junction resolvase